MAGRPEILFPLFSEVTTLPGIGPGLAKALEKLDITRPRDLLLTLPHSIIDRRPIPGFGGIALPAVVTVQGVVERHEPPRSRGRPWHVVMRDPGGIFHIVFFHPRKDWIRRQLPEGACRVVSGRAELFDGIPQIVHPDHILPPDQAETIPRMEPVYPLSSGLTQKTMHKAAAAALALAPDLPEWIEPTLLAQQAWPGWQRALCMAHAPSSQEDISPAAPARRRLAYDELFAHQLTLAIARARIRRAKGVRTAATGALQARALSALPYRPTAAQLRAEKEIAADMAAPYRMNRLLQGDVGAGKTLVAMLALLIAVEAGGQGVLMAPTEILAQQHLASLRPMAEAAGVRMEILTGRDSGRERAAKLAALASGEIDILLGTHAVFQQDVRFADLRLAIIDEQHRFGVRQRMSLGEKGQATDILVMTATPIPRSLALASYGDMDVSILDEKPAGRQPIRTVLVSAGRMEEVVAHLRDAVGRGQQAYWVCPLVEESETLDLTAAEERYRALRLALGEDTVGLVHGQMPASAKDAAMADFAAGKTRVLVATTVIEVGVDVPNATIIVIEGAERFGMAQLHQLRGRVGRGDAESTCLLMYTPPLGDTARARLTVLRDTDDGFRIAEEDLKLRGAGDLLGVQQSGLPRFRVADIETQPDLMQLAQDDARLLLSSDPTLEGPRGQAARILLYLMDQDKSIRLLKVG